MKSFILGSVLLLLAVQHESKEIVKRHLVERFTNNPFFLRHFGGGGHRTDYEIQVPGAHFLTESGPYQLEIYENDEDLPKFVSSVITNGVEDHVTEKIKTEIVHNPATGKTKTETEEPVFNTLPFFDKTVIFQLDQKKVHHQTEKEHHKTASKEAETTLYLFRSLPHFHSPVVFKEEILKDNIQKVDGAVNFAEEHPHVIPGDNHQAEKEHHKTVSKEAETTLHLFKSLPHFDSPIIFKEEIPKVDDIQKVDGAVVSAGLPDFPTANIFTEENLSVEEHHKAASKETETTLHLFKSLPHFHSPIIFKEEVVSGEENQRVEENPIEQNENVDVSFVFTSLPNFDVRKFNEPSSVAPEANGLELSTSGDLANLDLPNFFTDSPDVESEKEIVEPNSGKTLFLSKLNKDQNDEFRALPKFEVANFQAPVHKVGRKGRKMVRVVRRKKTRSGPERLEFGRRLQPRIRARGIADLPLEDKVLNSYGDLSQQ